jgi:hypothetical protein
MDDQPDSTKRNLLKSITITVMLFIVLAIGAEWTIHHFNPGPHPKIAIQSPVRTTEAWFAAVNAQNMPLAQAHFAPADRDQMDWSSWGQPFTHLHCSLTSRSQRSAGVNCTFSPQTDPSSGMSGDDFWTVDLVREPSGRWLITGYGQP